MPSSYSLTVFLETSTTSQKEPLEWLGDAIAGCLVALYAYTSASHLNTLISPESTNSFRETTSRETLSASSDHIGQFITQALTNENLSRACFLLSQKQKLNEIETLHIPPPIQKFHKLTHTLEKRAKVNLTPTHSMRRKRARTHAVTSVREHKQHAKLHGVNSSNRRRQNFHSYNASPRLSPYANLGHSASTDQLRSKRTADNLEAYIGHLFVLFIKSSVAQRQLIRQCLDQAIACIFEAAIDTHLRQSHSRRMSIDSVESNVFDLLAFSSSDDEETKSSSESEQTNVSSDTSTVALDASSTLEIKSQCEGTKLIKPINQSVKSDSVCGCHTLNKKDISSVAYDTHQSSRHSLNNTSIPSKLNPSHTLSDHKIQQCSRLVHVIDPTIDKKLASQSATSGVTSSDHQVERIYSKRSVGRYFARAIASLRAWYDSTNVCTPESLSLLRQQSNHRAGLLVLAEKLKQVKTIYVSGSDQSATLHVAEELLADDLLNNCVCPEGFYKYGSNSSEHSSYKRMQATRVFCAALVCLQTISINCQKKKRKEPKPQYYRSFINGVKSLIQLPRVQRLSVDTLQPDVGSWPSLYTVLYGTRKTLNGLL